jgi:hypothetical protein
VEKRLILVGHLLLQANLGGVEKYSYCKVVSWLQVVENTGALYDRYDNFFYPQASSCWLLHRFSLTINK